MSDDQTTEQPEAAAEAEAVEPTRTMREPLARWAIDDFPWLPSWFGRRLPDRFLGEAGHFFDHLKIEEGAEDGAYVVRAEIPGVDPDDDIDVSVEGGRLSIRAERSSRTERDEEGFRSEFRYGSFSRVIALPEGVDVDDIEASYADGILRIRVPLPDAGPVEAKKVPIGRG